MKSKRIWLSVSLFEMLAIPIAFGQQHSLDNPEQVTVPRLVQFSGTLKPVDGNPTAGAVGLNFALYKEQEGGTPLWMETHNVQPDTGGHYSVLLGATQAEGIPAELFASNEARWLGVQTAGEAEQPRVLLLSVPYALKAADAETLGGKPASAYALAELAYGGGSTSVGAKPVAASSDASPKTGASLASVSGGGARNFIPIWTSGSTLGNSTVFESAGKVGLGTTAPSDAFEVNAPSQLGVKIDGPVSGVGSGFDLQTTGTGGVFWEILATGNTATQGTGKLNIRNVNTGADMFTIAGANVGIGTTAPATKLEVNAPNQLGVKIDGPVSGVGSGLELQTTGAGGLFWEILATGNTATQGAGKLNIRNVNTGTDIFTIDSRGLGVVGIGTTTPTAKLDVETTQDAAGLFINNSGPGNIGPTVWIENETTNSVADVFDAIGANTGGYCSIDTNGSLFCTGSKSAVVPVDNGRKVALYAVEAPENWFEDYGGGKLNGGKATISLDPIFVQTVNTSVEYRVFLTPKGDCGGLYVTGESPQGFEVRELKAGQSNVEFDYRIIAHRKGYESLRLADRTDHMPKRSAPARR